MPYPTLADVHDDLAYLFKILTGAEAPQLNAALFHGWTLQGYLQGVVLPVQAAGTVTAQSSIDLSKFGKADPLQLLDALQALLSLSKEAKGLMTAQSADNDAATRLHASGLVDTLGPALLVQLAQVLLPGLMEWLKTWLSEGQLQEFINNLLSKRQAATA